EELPLAGDVATVALGQHVLAEGTDRLTGDDIRPDRSLDRDLEHLPRDQLLEPPGEDPPDRDRLLAVDDHRQSVDRLAGDEDVEADKVGWSVADLLVVERGIAGGPGLELVVVVDDELGQRELEAHQDPDGV